MSPSRELVEAQVAGMLDALDELLGLAGDELAERPLELLRERADFTVHIAAGAPSGPADGCDVAGSYRSVAGRPTIVVADAGRPRMAFTALHELGHYLQQNDRMLVGRLVAAGDRSREFEERACDVFAAEIVLRPALVAAHLADGVTAISVIELWQAAPAASRSAVCVAASRNLPSPGHVTLTDCDGVVVFDAAYGLPRLRRGSDQSWNDAVHGVLTTNAPTVTVTGRFRYRQDIEGDPLYMQATDIGGYVLVVSVRDRAPWRHFTIPLPDPGPRARSWNCEQCGHGFSAWERPCARCGAPTCPECGRCNCVPAELVCTKCFLRQPTAAFAAGSSVCEDCA